MNNEGNSRIAFIGGGNMARALIGGLLRQGVPARQLCVGEPQPGARESLEHELGVATAADNSEAIHDAALVVLAVKPQVAAQVLQGLHSPLLARRPVLLSIVAGLRIADLARLCPQALPIVRALRNAAWPSALPAQPAAWFGCAQRPSSTSSRHCPAAARRISFSWPSSWRKLASRSAWTAIPRYCSQWKPFAAPERWLAAMLRWPSSAPRSPPRVAPPRRR